MNTPEQRGPATRSGKRYANFKELLQSDDVSDSLRAKVKSLGTQSRVATQLAQLRQKAELSQSELGGRIGKTQSAISKLEAGADDPITLGEIKAYAEATGQRIGFVFGKPLTHAEAIRHHALAMRSRMLELAKLANSESEFEADIAKFFGQAFFNLLNIMTECSDKLPAGSQTGFEIRIENYESRPQRPARAKKRESAQDLVSA